MSARPFRSLLLILLALLTIALAVPRPAVAGTSLSGHVTLIVVPGLTYQDVIESRDQPMVELLTHSAIGLLSPGNARKPNPTGNLYATLYAGDTANTKNPNRNLLLKTVAYSSKPNAVTVLPSESLAMAALIAKSEIARGSTIVICGFPPLDPTTAEWNQLSAVVVCAENGPQGELLTSPTTQTPGLVALRDIAPTVLKYSRLPIPATMSGAAVTQCGLWTTRADLSRMARLAHLNARILLPTMWLYGTISFVALLAALWSVSTGKRQLQGKRAVHIILPSQRVVTSTALTADTQPSLLRYFLRMAAALPLALLLAPLIDPHSLLSYGAAIVCCGLLLAAIPSMGGLAALTVFVIVVDGFTGTHLVARSALSGYWISGIRFYGIGNEYMGVLIGYALVASYYLYRSHYLDPIPAFRNALLAAVYLAIAVALSYPAFGAKAGGAVTSLTAFIPAWLHLACGRKLTWRTFAASAIAGFALVFVWAAVAHFTGARVTHIQTAAAHATHGDIGYIWHVALRKAKMAILTATVPGVLLTYVGMIPVWLLWKRTTLRDRVREHLAADPLYNGLVRVAIGTSAAALLFNDSGFVAMVFIFLAPAVTLIHEMLSAPSKSVEQGPAAAGSLELTGETPK